MRRRGEHRNRSAAGPQDRAAECVTVASLGQGLDLLNANGLVRDLERVGKGLVRDLERFGKNANGLVRHLESVLDLETPQYSSSRRSSSTVRKSFCSVFLRPNTRLSAVRRWMARARKVTSVESFCVSSWISSPMRWPSTTSGTGVTPPKRPGRPGAGRFA